RIRITTDYGEDRGAQIRRRGRRIGKETVNPRTASSDNIGMVQETETADQRGAESHRLGRLPWFRLPSDAIESRPQNGACLLLEAGSRRVARKQPVDEGKCVNDLVVDRDLVIAHDLV